MSLLYILLFATPFHSDPRLGTVLFNAGLVIVTPIKILGLLTAVVALVGPPPQGVAPRLPNSLVGLFLPFAIVPAVATIVYGLPVPTAAISQLISAAFLFVAIVPLVRTEERMIKVVRALVLGFAFGSLWVFKQYLMGGGRPGGLEQDANYEALMLLLALPPAFWMARYEDSRRWRHIGLTCGLLLALAVVLTESRGGIIAGGVMGVLAAVRSRRKFLGVTLLAVAAAVVFSFGPSGLSQRFEGIKFSGQVQSSNEISPRIHLELLKAGLRMMKAHPIFGVGLERFKAVAPDYNPEILKLSQRSWIAHDIFVQIGSEAGIPALLLFLAMLGVAFRNFRLTQQSSDERLAALGLAMEVSLIGISIAGLSISSDFLPFCIIIVLSHSLREIAHAANVERSPIESVPTPTSQPPKRAA
jgi:O-antigen ligase